MRLPRLASRLTLAALALLPSAALAEDTQQNRCGSDYLTPDQAIARSEWARRCGLLRNTAGASSWYSSGAAFDTSFGPVKEYRELTTSRAYTGNAHHYNVNYYHARSLYEATPLFSVFQETSGSTAGYWKWSHTVPRVRALYPTFESTGVAGSGTQLFPHPTNTNDCRLYSTPNGTGLWQTVTQRYVCDGEYPSLREPEIGKDNCYFVTETTERPFYVVAYCESGCYAPDQRLLFSDGEATVQEAAREGREDLMTLGPDATLDDLKLQRNTVSSYTTDARDSEHVLYEVSTETGGLLRVTNEHPVVTSEGRLVKAETLVAGDELLRVDGTPERIVEVRKTTHYGKVFNVRPVSRDAVSNVLVAQGYLVGSARFQNEDVEHINRLLLQRAIPAEVLPE
ncbi:cell surface protein [Pyxidicoccus trucidator]|uniref:cell surface protein n=1 Tax=Pyxidicoccus trucidator TaxID=2709662 RepID=UPI0013DACC24|nr:cell surface protein [Pyxidicoccus trucidator]